MTLDTGGGTASLHVPGVLGTARVSNACTNLVPELRDMVAEPTAATYLDAQLADLIARYPLIDASGYEPDDLGWSPTYDLNAAAASLWRRKQAQMATAFDFSADGGDFKRSQAFDMAGKMARYYQSLAAPHSLTLHIDHRFERDYQSTYWENPTATPDYVANRAEEDEGE
jgi:hypothetical protein